MAKGSAAMYNLGNTTYRPSLQPTDLSEYLKGHSREASAQQKRPNALFRFLINLLGPHC